MRDWKRVKISQANGGQLQNILVSRVAIHDEKDAFQSLGFGDDFDVLREAGGDVEEPQTLDGHLPIVREKPAHFQQLEDERLSGGFVLRVLVFEELPENVVGELQLVPLLLVLLLVVVVVIVLVLLVHLRR
jgi:hypothetical protein